MKYLFLSLALAAAIFTTTARAETINCTEITAIPMVITVQGIYCLKGNLATSLTSGNMIDIQTNNVTIDFNGFKLGGLAGGPGTNANGIFAQNRKNITLRNGPVRGFRTGIFLSQFGIGVSSGHLIEDMLLDGNIGSGIAAQGSGMIIRRNRVINTGAAGPSITAVGMSINNAGNSVIADNLVSGTTGSFFAYGINVLGSSLIELRGNTIFNTTNPTLARGIVVGSTADITMMENRVLNAAGSGNTGIFISANSTSVNCIDNTIAGFALALSACDFSVGNNTAP